MLRLAASRSELRSSPRARAPPSLRQSKRHRSSQSFFPWWETRSVATSSPMLSFHAALKQHRMNRNRTRKRPNEANALARWDNEGGAAKGAPQKARDDMTSLAKEEEHILRCLGAAVIMQWDDLPTTIQRELFEHAIAMGKLQHTAELKGQIARFLHKHQGRPSRARLD